MAYHNTDFGRIYVNNGYNVEETKLLLKLCKDDCRAELGQFEELLKKGADPNSRDREGVTPLIYGSYYSEDKVVELLLHYKADVNMTNLGGYTALHYACMNGHVEVARLLLQSGASVDVKDRVGHTPLDYASQRVRSDIVAMLERGDFSTPAPTDGSTTTTGNDKVEPTDPVSQSEGDCQGTPGNVLPPDNNTTTSPQEFILPKLSTPDRYKCVAQSALGLVYLPGTSNQTVSIEPVTDSKLHPNLESNEILLTPIVSLSPQQVALDRNQPAIIELTKSVEPTDLNPNRKLIPILCASPSQWEELASRDCKMLPDRIQFKTTRFGYLSVKVRFPFPSASATVDPIMRQQAKIEIQELPGFKVEVPPASVQSATEIKATVLYDSPQVTEQFKGRSLASTCVKLEPDGSQFEEKVKITLPIPNYNRIKQKYPDAKLEVWLSKSTHKGVATAWEEAPFTTHIDENGNCLAIAYVTHFSLIDALWNRPVDFVMNFFTTQVHGRCQVFMSAEKRLASFLTFGVTVLLHPFNALCQGVPPNYPYLLFDSIVPIDVAVGDVECQVDLNDAILHTLSIDQKQKSHKESVIMSRDCNMRADFNMELQSDTKSSELPAGTAIATLLIKHGSEKNRPHKFTLIKPLESAVDRAKETPPSPATVKAPPTLPKRPLESSVDSAKACLDAIEKAANGLKKSTKEMKQQNVLTLSARRVAKHMQRFTELASNASGSCTEGDKITDIVQLIIEGSEEIRKPSEKIAQECTHPILKKNLQAELAKIPDVLQPLKFLLRNLKQKQYDEETSQKAVDLLTTNATNLRSVVEAVLKAADTAIIKVPKPELEKLAIKEKLGIDDLHQVQTAAWEARAKWYNCGLALGLSAGTLDAIKKDNPNNCGDCFTETLKEWLKGANPPPSWSALCNALESPSVGYI